MDSSLENSNSGYHIRFIYLLRIAKRLYLFMKYGSVMILLKLLAVDIVILHIICSLVIAESEEKGEACLNSCM